MAFIVHVPVYTCTYRMFTVFAQLYVYMTPCHSAVPSAQLITGTSQYDRYDDLSFLIRNDEFASSLTNTE